MPHTTLRSFLVCVGISAGWALSTPARAEPTEAEVQRAREIYENGQALYREGRYEDALVAFEEAYRLSERPGLLYNMASCSERLGDYRGALAHLNRYRVYATPDERVALERRLTNLELRLADAAAAAVPPPPPAPPPEDNERRGFGRTGRALLIAGSSTAAVAGSVQAVTYVRSLQWVADGNRDTWEAWQPVNLTAGSLTALGGAMAFTGLILGVSGIDQQGPSIRVGPSSLGVGGRF